MVFSCSKCDFTTDSEKGFKIHNTKQHNGEARLKEVYFHGKQTERQQKDLDSTRPSSSRGRYQGQHHGKRTGSTEQQQKPFDSTWPCSSRGGRGHDLSRIRQTHGDAHQQRHDSAKTSSRGNNHESRRGRPSSDCGYRSDSRQNHTGQGNEMLKKLVFEPYQRSESTSNSFSSRGGRHESRRGRPSSTARSDSRQNHIGRGSSFDDRPHSSSRGPRDITQKDQSQRRSQYQGSSFDDRPHSSSRGPRDITQKDQPQRRSQYQGSSFDDRPHSSSRGPRDITQKDQPQRRSQYQDSSLDDKFSTSSREAKSAVKSDYSDIKLTKKSVSEVSKIVKRFIEDFQQKLEEISSLTFERLNSGSYYDKTKNSEPDEFDFMFSPKHVNVKPDYSGATEGYCKLAVMSVPPEIQSSSTSGKYLDPSKLRGYIFDLFDKVFADSLFRKSRQTKKKHRTGDSPAYTILYTGIPNKVLDIDLVPAIKILGWPDKARRVNPTWTDDSKLKAECMEYYHAVAKSCPDEVPGANMFWRLSFSWSEKKLIKHANSGDSRGCRKQVFRLLKGTIENIKEQNPDRIKKFCSYHLKMFMLGQFDEQKYQSDSEDAASLFYHALRQLLQALGGCDKRVSPKIKNYFIPTDNVLRTVPPQEINLVCTGLKQKLDSLAKM